MKYNKKKIIIAMCIAILFMITGYALISTRLNIQGMSNLTDSWGVRITNITSSATGRAYNISEPSYTGTSMTFEVGVKEPGDKMTFTVTVENFGSIDAILEKIDASASGTAIIKYSISGIQEQSRLLSGDSLTFTVTTEFDIDATSIPENAVKDLTISLNYIQDDGQTLIPSNPTIDEATLLAAQILKNNNVQSDENIDFSQISSDTNGKGLYSTTTDRGTVYYFRGDVNNNYVQFGEYQKDNYEWHVSPVGTVFPYGHTTYESCLETASVYGGTDCEKVGAIKGDPMYWRIVRINEDSTIRLVYTGTSLDDITGELIDQNFSTYYGDAYIKYTDTRKKTILENWYTNQLESVYGEYINDSVFCNDIEVFKTVNGEYYGNQYSDDYYNGYNRVLTYQPTYNCSLNSSLTVAAGDISKPIGLLTADEVMYAGGVISTANTSYYLKYIDSVTMTPSRYDSPLGPTPVTYRVTNGTLGIITDNSNDMVYIYPVINLKATVGATGNGTAESPYVINVD